MASGFLTSVIGCLIIMFYPKQKLLFAGVDVDNNLQLVHTNSVGSSSLKGRLISKIVQRVDSVKSRISSESVENNNSKSGLNKESKMHDNRMSIKYEKSLDGNKESEIGQLSPPPTVKEIVRQSSIKVVSKRISNLGPVDENSENVSAVVREFETKS